MKPFLTALAMLCMTIAITHAAHAAERRTVKLSDFEVNPADAYPAFAKAIASGAQVIVIDNPGQELLISRPIILRSDLELVFQDGVVLTAAKGAFQPPAASLFAATNVKNLVIRGQGKATLRMRKADYQDPNQYKHSEWRHLLAFRGVENVVIRNLTLLASGGDGIYLGCTKETPYCKDFLIEDVLIDDHHRQGISVISAENLIIRRCTLTNTVGTAPQAGLCFEPNHTPDGQRLVNILVEDCDISDNARSGVAIYSVYMEGGKPPQSMTFRRNRIAGNGDGGAKVTTSFYRTGREHIAPPTGFIRFEECDFLNNNSPALIIADHIPTVDLVFDRCKVQVGQGGILLAARAMRGSPIGNVVFNDLQVNGLPAGEELIQFKAWTDVSLEKFTGDITVNGKPYDLAGRIAAINEQIRQNNLDGFKPASVSWRHLRTPANVEQVESQEAVGFRGNFMYVTTAKAGQQVEIQLKMTNIRTMRVMNVKVVDAKGKELASGEMSAKQPALKLSFVAPADGAYLISSASASDTVQITSNRPGGMLLNQALLISGTTNDLWFAVPEGLRQFEVQVAGRMGRAPVRAILYDGQGRQVARKDDIEQPWRIKTNRKTTGREAWRLVVEMESILEVADVRLGQGLENVIAGSAASLPILNTRQSTTGQGNDADAGRFTGHEN